MKHTKKIRRPHFKVYIQIKPERIADRILSRSSDAEWRNIVTGSDGKDYLFIPTPTKKILH